MMMYFTDQNEPKRVEHMKINFDYFQIQKIVLQTVRAEKSRWKNEAICLTSMFPSKGVVLNCPKKFIFCNFVLFSAKNLSLLKQLVYMHLKVLITLFLKMIWFIGVWANVHELLAIKISKNMLTQE